MFTLLAILMNGILGPLKNKVGGVIAASWKGINYVRSYVIPEDPQTAAQVTERTHFGALGLFAKRILTTVIQPYWDPFYSQMSGYNAFIQYHRLNTDPPMDPADLFVARGNLESETLLTAVYAAGEVEFTWTPAGLGNGLDTDNVCSVVVDMENDVAFVQDGVATRVDGSDTLQLGTGRTVAQLKGYVFFYRGSGETLEVSNSDFIQLTT